MLMFLNKNLFLHDIPKHLYLKMIFSVADLLHLFVQYLVNLTSDLHDITHHQTGLMLTNI